MNSRRGAVFFWIVQVLLLPAWVCFAATLALKLGAYSPALWKVGLAMGLIQVPCTALAIIFVVAARMGGLLSSSRLRLMFASTGVTVVLVTLVFLWRDAYRR